jgi:hypothetical protein
LQQNPWVVRYRQKAGFSASARQKVDVLLSARKSYLQAPSPGRMMERQTRALETIAARLGDIDAKLDRVLKVVERDNPAITPF